MKTITKPASSATVAPSQIRLPEVPADLVAAREKLNNITSALAGPLSTAQTRARNDELAGQIRVAKKEIESHVQARADGRSDPAYHAREIERRENIIRTAESERSDFSAQRRRDHIVSSLLPAAVYINQRQREIYSELAEYRRFCDQHGRECLGADAHFRADLLERELSEIEALRREKLNEAALRGELHELIPNRAAARIDTLRRLCESLAAVRAIGDASVNETIGPALDRCESERRAFGQKIESATWAELGN